FVRAEEFVDEQPCAVRRVGVEVHGETGEAAVFHGEGAQQGGERRVGGAGPAGRRVGVVGDEDAQGCGGGRRQVACGEREYGLEARPQLLRQAVRRAGADVQEGVGRAVVVREPPGDRAAAEFRGQLG